MSTSRIEPERVRALNDRPANPDGRYVLYWMDAAQRTEHNPALELAAQRANDAGAPLVVAAVVDPAEPGTTGRRMAFRLGGLGRTLPAAARRGARPCLRVGDAVDAIADLAADAVEVVVDRGYLRHQVERHDRLVERAHVTLTRVEGEVVVPTELASDRAEHAARTIRPRLRAVRDRFLVDLRPTTLRHRVTPGHPPHHTRSDIDLDRLAPDRLAGERLVELLVELGVDDGTPPAEGWTPGTPSARRALADVLDRLDTYDDDRVRFASPDGSSRLSPYLRSGQISPVAVAHAAVERAGDAAEPFLEELIVRRELAVNFVVHTLDYDSWSALPDWSRRTLAEHADDDRDHVYTASELEAGATHDDVWNAIMHTIRERGWVHNQLRMYWGKQVLYWINTPDHAYRTLRDLNNRWFLDGDDPNSFANVGWCFGLHDRGFAEGDVRGTVRPFTTAALRRKDDLDAWLRDHRTQGAEAA